MHLEEKQRTLLQNRSLHKYCADIASLLNESGISMAIFFQDIEVDFTMEIIKELFRKIARVKYNKTSTKTLTTSELTAIAEEVNRHLAKHGLHVEWPSKESL